MKKAIAALLSLVMLVSCMSFAALAAEVPTLAIVAEENGTTVDYTVYLRDSAKVEGGVWAMEFFVDIPEGLTYVPGSAEVPAECDEITGFEDSYIADPELKWVTTGAEGQGYTGEEVAVLTFQCTIDADAPYDEALTVTATGAIAFDSDSVEVELAVDTEEASVIIDAPHVCDPTPVEEEPATCTEPGTKAHEKCEVCGKLYIDGVEVTEADLVIPAMGHTMTYDEGSEPSCEGTGVAAHWYCEVCEKYFADEEGTEELTEADLIIPAKGHKWEWVIDKEATEDETGLKHQECSECHAVKDEGTVIPKKDGFSVVVPSDEEGEDEVVLPFFDVFQSDWFYNDIVYVYEHGLMNGMSATEFGPYGITTRGQIVTILYRLEGEPEVVGACPFTDVAVGSYYEKAITWAAANGIVTGYDATTFGPEDQITREQMAAILFRYAQGKGLASVDANNNLVIFNDANQISGYAMEAMNWAVGQGLINGMGDGTVAPQGNAIRAQAAAILHRFCETLELL